MLSEPKIYTITFDTGEGSTVHSQIVQENKKATKPTVDPPKADSVFDGWYKESACINEG